MGRTTFSAAALLIGLVLGIVSAINALGVMGLKPDALSPRWSEWRLADKDSMLVYSLGHFLGEGQLPPSKSTRYFVRSLDDDGNGLRADCIYVIQVEVTPARWWTMSVAPFGVAAPHAELSAGEAVVSQDGILKASISARPQPGNWIAPADSSAMSLVYVINEAVEGQPIALPSVTKSGC